MSNTLRPAHTLTSSLLVATALAVTFGTTRTVSAGEACGDTECPKGYMCETFSAGCPLLACMEGEDCKPCEPTDYQECVPAECKTDADCDAHMKCAAIEQTECTGATTPTSEPCAANTDCKVAAPDQPASCTTTTLHECQPEWTLPCTANADCGDGFACKELESCWCSGSSGSGKGTTGSTGTAGGAGIAAAGGGTSVDAPPPADDVGVSNPVAPEDAGTANGDVGTQTSVDMPEDCGCEPTGEFACRVVETACAKDSDCPTDWTCEDNPMGACWASSDGTSGCTPADPPMVCQPPYSKLGGSGYAQAATGTASGEGGVLLDDRADSNSTNDPDVNGAPSGEPPKAADPVVDHAADSGDPGPTTIAPRDADEEAPAADAANDSNAGSSLAGGGCSVSTGSSAMGPFGLLFAAAMAAVGLRRRFAR